MSEFTELINGDKPTLVDFFATWCGPCKMQAPILEDVKHSVGELANVIKIDVDRNQSLAMQYRVQSVPTLMLFKRGEVVWRVSGLQQASDIEAKIREVI
jgi:thioredoxin 1